MKTTLKTLALFLTVCTAAHAQVVPAATGPGGLPVSGSLHYALRYSETAQFSSLLPDMQTVAVSGSADYANVSERRPFSMNYAGGYTWTPVGPSYETGLFQRMLLSQGIDWRKWQVLVSDDVSYLPQSPTTGFSGIPGVGEPIGGTNPPPSTSQSILVLNTHVVDNIAKADLEHSFSAATALSAGGSDELLRYPDGNGYNTDTESAILEITQRLNARNRLLGRYAFSQFSYPDLPGVTYSVTFTTNTGLFGFQHKWSRNLTTDVAAGPQWLSSSEATLLPSSTNVSVNADTNLLLRFTSAGVSYSRSTNGGGGYLVGGETDIVQGNVLHEFGTNLTIGLTGGYLRTAGLSNNGLTTTAGLNTGGVTDSTFGGAQATWRFGRNIIVFANYTGTDQWSTSALPANAINQLLQVVGFGVGYSPRDTHLRQ